MRLANRILCLAAGGGRDVGLGRLRRRLSDHFLSSFEQFFGGPSGGKSRRGLGLRSGNNPTAAEAGIPLPSCTTTAPTIFWAPA